MQSAPERLPRGRHSLSRSDVVATQRARMLEAMTEVSTERGYIDTPVAAVLERAGVSRETFYQQFESKQDCFIAALEDAIGRLAATLDSLVASTSGRPLDRYDALLAGYLGAVGQRPAIARLFLIETYAAGPEAMRRRLELQRQFVAAVARIFGARTARDRFAAEALVATTISAVTARFITDDVDGLTALRPRLHALAATLFG